MATPPPRPQHLTDNCPLYIKQKLTDKRKSRRRWQITRAPEAKPIYNKHVKELKHLLHTHRNTGIQQYLENLTPQKDTNYFLWNTTRKMKHPQHHITPLRLQNNTWARTDKQKAATFAHHLSTVFRPFPSQATADEEDDIIQELSSLYQTALPLQETCIREVKNIIQYHTNPTKAPRYDLHTGTVLKELPHKGFRALTQIYNANLRLEYFPRYWKIGQIIMTVKPGKDPTEVTSYRPISFLPLLSKILEKLLL